MPKIEAQTRAEIAEFLPKALKTAIGSYMQFSKAPHHTDGDARAKDFKDHHDACKVALAHIKLLIELARWADIPTEELTKEMEQAEYAAIITMAQGELGAR